MTSIQPPPDEVHAPISHGRLVACWVTHLALLALFAVPEWFLVRQAWRDHARNATAWAVRLAFTTMFVTPYVVYAALTSALVVWLLRRPRTVLIAHLVVGLIASVVMVRYVHVRY